MKDLQKSVAALLLFFLLTITITPIYATDANYVWSTIKEESILTNANISDQNNILSLESGSAILIEQNSGTILYEHNSHEALRPASVTKVMTILLIMEAIDSRKNIL